MPDVAVRRVILTPHSLTMRIRLALTALALLACPAIARAQGTAADSAHWRATKLDLDSIARDKTAPLYSKRAQARIRARDSLRMVAPVTPIPPAPVIANIDIISSASSAPVGSSLQLTAVAKQANGGIIPDAPIAWGVSPTSVADLSGVGLLTGKAKGTATVSARSGTVVASRTYQVTDTAVTPPTPIDTAKFDGVAELPRSRVDITIPTGYNVVNVGAQPGALQAALDAAGCRTELRGAPDFSYAPLTLRSKPCNERYHTIIRTANGLPDVARGTRMTPMLSAQRNQTKIVTTGLNVSAVVAGPGVKGYYFEDVNIRATAGPVNGLVTLGTTQTTLAEVPGDFVFSHVYTGGTPTGDLKRCWYLNSFSTAVVDSWSDECHSNASDSQWVLFLNGPGPYLLQNNYGEGGHEVVMSGGGDPSIPGLIPSDITIIGNHITRPASWKGVWGVKNLVEGKNARRMLLEGNVIENNWADGQVGYAFNVKSVNQGGNAPWSQSRDVVVRYNLIRNTGAGFNLCASCQGTVVPATALVFHDNIVTGVNVGQFLGEAREWQFLSPLTNVSVQHNTTVNAANVATAISFDGQPPKITGLLFQSNAYDNGAYGVHGGSGGSDFRAWVDTATSTWSNNLGYPKGGYLAAGFDARGFYSGTLMGHDGKPLGADADKVYAMTAGVVVSDPLRLQLRQLRRVATPRQTGYQPTSEARRQYNTRH